MPSRFYFAMAAEQSVITLSVGDGVAIMSTVGQSVRAPGFMRGDDVHSPATSRIVRTNAAGTITWCVGIRIVDHVGKAIVSAAHGFDCSDWVQSCCQEMHE
jgi:hypothetical protein